MADGALTGDGHVVGVVHFVADLVVVVRRRRRGARLADGRRRRRALRPWNNNKTER